MRNNILIKIRNFFGKWFNPNITSFSNYLKGGNIQINHNTALTYSAVYACVKVIAETISTIPLFVYRERKGYKEKATEHNLYTLLHDFPNEEMTNVDFWKSILLQTLLLGNGYAEIVFNKKNEIEGLYLLDAEKMQVGRDEKTNKIIYAYRNDKTNNEIIFDSRKILHIKGLGSNGLIGLSPISLMRLQIATGIMQDNFAKDFYSNGAKKTPILKAPSGFSEDAKKNTVKGFREGFEKGIVLLEDGLDADFVTMNLTDAEFLANRRFNIEDIARVYRVPLHLIGDLTRSTNNNIEHQSIEFVEHTIRPWVVSIEKTIKMKLFTKEELKKGYFAEFNVDGLLRGDTKTRVENYTKLFNIGALTINEIRKKENMSEIKEKHGSDTFITQQVRPVSIAYTQEENKNKKENKTEAKEKVKEENKTEDTNISDKENKENKNEGKKE